MGAVSPANASHTACRLAQAVSATIGSCLLCSCKSLLLKAWLRRQQAHSSSMAGAHSRRRWMCRQQRRLCWMPGGKLKGRKAQRVRVRLGYRRGPGWLCVALQELGAGCGQQIGCCKMMPPIACAAPLLQTCLNVDATPAGVGCAALSTAGQEHGHTHPAPADGEDQQHQSQHQGQQQQTGPSHHHGQQQHHESGWPSAGAGLQGSGLQGAAQWGPTGLACPGTGFVGSLPAPHSSGSQQPMPGWGSDADWDQEGLQQQQWQGSTWQQQQVRPGQPVPPSTWDTSGCPGAVCGQERGFVHPPPRQQQEEEEEGGDWGHQSGASAGHQVPWQAQTRQQQPQGGWGLLGPASTEQWYGPDVMSEPSPAAPAGLACNSAQHAGAPSISASGFAAGGRTHGWSGWAAGSAGAGAAAACAELPASRRRVSGSAAASLF